MAKVWNCEICDTPVHELGAHVKLAMNRYSHVTCHDTQVALAAIEQHEKNVREKKIQDEIDQRRQEEQREEQAKQARLEKQRREAELAVSGTRKCVRCQAPITLPSSEHPNTCNTCWNSNMQTLAIAMVTKPLEKLDKELEKLGGKEDAKKEEVPRKPDRFDLLDLD